MPSGPASAASFDADKILLLASAMILNSLIGVDMGSMTGALPDMLRTLPFPISSLEAGMISSSGLFGAMSVAIALVLVPSVLPGRLGSHSTAMRTSSSFSSQPLLVPRAGGEEAGTATAGGGRGAAGEAAAAHPGGGLFFRVPHGLPGPRKTADSDDTSMVSESAPQLGSATSGGATAEDAVLERSKRRMAISVAMFLIGRVASVSSLVASARALVIARFVSGMGVGLASASAPQVSAAMCPPRYRGRVFAGQQAIMCSLVVCGSVAGRVMLPWRRILSLSMLPPIVGGSALAASYLVKTPPMELPRDRHNCAHAAADVGVPKPSLLDQWSAPTGPGPVLRRAMSLSLSVVVLQHLTGHSASIFFTELLLTGPGGWADRAAAADVSFYLALLKLSCCAIAFGLLDRVGRRILILAGGMVASASLVLALIAFTLRSPMLSAAALSLTTVCFQVSFGPLGWLLPSELLPSSVQSEGLAIVMIANFATLGVVTFCWGALVVPGGFGLIAIALQAAGAACLTWWVHAWLPETMGKSLPEIQAELCVSGAKGGCEAHDKRLDDLV